MGLRGLRRWQGWCAEQGLKVFVATIDCLGNVFAGTPERVLSANLAAKLLVAVAGERDVRREHEGLAAMSLQLAIGAFDMEVLETAAWHLVWT